MSRTLKIDLFTDPVCPWCLIGSVRLDRVLETLGPDIEADVENHPFYLDPDTPEEGVVVADMLREKYGRDPKEMWARVEAEAAKSGIVLDLSRQPRMYPTAKAHTLTRQARPLGTQHALANAIAAAYFLDHRQISDDDVLAGLGAAHGLDAGAARAAINDPEELSLTAEMAAGAAAHGIRGVPFFVFDRKVALSGAQPEEVIREAIVQALDGGG